VSVFDRWVPSVGGGSELACDGRAAAGVEAAGLDRGTGLPVLPDLEDPTVGAFATGYVDLGHGLETVAPGSVLIVADEGAGSAFGYVIGRCRPDRSAPCDEITVGVDLATWRDAGDEE
jgi:hypothetical protein